MGKQLKSFAVLLVILKAIFPSHHKFLLWSSSFLSLIICYVTYVYSKVLNLSDFYLEGDIGCIIPRDFRQTSTISATASLTSMLLVSYPHVNDNAVSQVVDLEYRWDAQRKAYMR